MHYCFRATILTLLLFFVTSSLGQAKPSGLYFAVDTAIDGTISTERLFIRKDSLWWEFEKVGKAVPKGERFLSAAGSWKYYSKGFDKPFYHGSLMVMQCDTCPTFWQYTTKPVDSLSYTSWVYGKTDTIVKNGDTTYVTPELIFTNDEDVNRIRELDFTLTANGDIVMHHKVYRRIKRKS